MGGPLNDLHHKVIAIFRARDERIDGILIAGDNQARARDHGAVFDAEERQVAVIVERAGPVFLPAEHVPIRVHNRRIEVVTLHIAAPLRFTERLIVQRRL